MKKHFTIFLILTLLVTSFVISKEPVSHYISSLATEVEKRENTDSSDQIALIEQKMAKIQRKVCELELKIQKYRELHADQKLTEDKLKSKIEKCEQKIKAFQEMLISCDFIKNRITSSELKN